MVSSFFSVESLKPPALPPPPVPFSAAFRIQVLNAAGQSDFGAWYSWSPWASHIAPISDSENPRPLPKSSSFDVRVSPSGRRRRRRFGSLAPLGGAATEGSGGVLGTGTGTGTGGGGGFWLFAASGRLEAGLGVAWPP